ncbi:ROK family transcriptional regulator [Anaerocolumna sp. MB42-C2]|uniref:ROK family transcriptional regulator n=1 Tax=Anaerocolumna sp. MB42-C2 TaxID=3070997 RepID=UPI0027DF582C|nr:ROK family transcriptional regulator [Anaerocolumna sp. MB42-C2]WMJ90085.1 ROK family transcriptional regulator [Anaerocolumna sp. MB42-C2]
MTHISDIKDKNKHDIIKLLYTKHNLSKKRIAIELGLSPSVLTKLCNELKEEGLIMETSPLESLSAGRKEIGISIKPDYKYCFGITLNHKKTSILLVDMGLSVLDEVQFTTSSYPEEHLNGIIDSLRKLIDKHNLGPHQILGIGISLKGITDGIHTHSGIWNLQFNVKEVFERNLKIPVVIDNGIRCSAMLEQLTTSDNNFLFIKYMEPGIGGAVIKHGRVQKGESHSIMDFGHLIMDKEGDYCPICKRRGCLESLISIESILQYTKDNFSNNETSLLRDLCDGNIENINIQNIMQAADKGCILYNKLFKHHAEYLAIALINTLAVMDIKKVIMIGDLFSSKRFCEYFRYAIYEYQLTPIYDNIEIHIHKNELLSPIALVLNEFLFV